MIEIKDKKACCGCFGCENICPKGCLEMVRDEEGFRYPVIDRTLCIDCDLCDKVCPVLHSERQHAIPETVMAVYHTDDELRRESSSGGVFSELAINVIQEGGVVYGAGFDAQWSVVHQRIESIEDLHKIRRSKYTESMIGKSYTQVKQDLKDGITVLFSGAPCQIAGLKSFLMKDYENLITVDFICHGVPSPRILEDYLKAIAVDNSLHTIRDVQFRNKTHGWTKFSLLVASENGKMKRRLLQPMYRNPYLKGFLMDLYSRPSCYDCHFKGFSSGADITLGDFWKIGQSEALLNDDKGVSVVNVNSKKGSRLFDLVSCRLISFPADYRQLKAGNGYIETSVEEPAERSRFFAEYAAGKDILTLLKKYTDYTMKQKIELVFKSVINRLKKRFR